MVVINCQVVIVPKRHGLLSDLFLPNNLIWRSFIKFLQFQISCLSRVPPCNHVLTIAPQFLFVFLFLLIACLLFCPLLLITSIRKSGHLKCDCNTITLPRSSSLHTVNIRVSAISLAGGFWSQHISLRRCDMFIIFRGQKLVFLRESIFFI